MGHLEQARPWAHAGLARARELAHGVTLAHALHHACVFHQLCREPAALEPLADELIALAGEHGLAFWQALGRVFRGNHLLEAGPGGRRARGACAPASPPTAPPAASSTCPTCWRCWPRPAAGSATTPPGCRRSPRPGRWSRRPACAASSPTCSASRRRCCATRAPIRRWSRQALERSIALAHKQKARLSELRATVELARLWQGQGRSAEARARLQPLYAWFTEGLHSADLRAAKDPARRAGLSAARAANDSPARSAVAFGALLGRAAAARSGCARC